jgi:hypothetical protein
VIHARPDDWRSPISPGAAPSANGPQRSTQNRKSGSQACFDQAPQRGKPSPAISVRLCDCRCAQAETRLVARASVID